MLVSPNSYMYEMIRSELTDIVGDEFVCNCDADAFGHSIDYYWIPEMWHDRGMETPKPDFIVHPATSQEVSKIVKLANHYKIPVIPWGGADLRRNYPRYEADEQTDPHRQRIIDRHLPDRHHRQTS